MPLRSELRYAICLMAFCFLSFQGICQPKTTIYLFPGQGSDSRLFDSLSFDSNFRVMDVIYPVPSKGMTMKEYAYVISGQIDTTAPYILIGVSLGGMICTELCEILEPEKTIIISSAKTPNELPFRYNFQRMVPLYKLFPAKWLHKGAQMLQPVVEPDRRKQKETFKSMLKGKDPVYIRRTIEMIVEWDRKDYDTAIVHIHGNQDHTIPIRRVRCNYTVKGGSHMMTLTRFEQINALLNHELL